MKHCWTKITALVEYPLFWKPVLKNISSPSAAGMPDSDHAAKPKILPAARPKRQADEPLPAGLNTKPKTVAHQSGQPNASCARACLMPSSSTNKTKSDFGSRLPKLANVVYHNKIGSASRTHRTPESIAAHIAKALGADAAAAERAARLAKADLVTGNGRRVP